MRCSKIIMNENVWIYAKFKRDFLQYETGRWVFLKRVFVDSYLKEPFYIFSSNSVRIEEYNILPQSRCVDILTTDVEDDGKYNGKTPKIVDYPGKLDSVSKKFLSSKNIVLAVK